MKYTNGHFEVTGTALGKRIKRTRFDTMESARALLDRLDSGTLWEFWGTDYEGGSVYEIIERVKS